MRMLMSHVHCNEIKFEVQEAKRLMSVRTTHLIYELEKETSTVCTMFWHVHVPVSRFQLVQISRKGGMNFLCVDVAAVVEIPGTLVSKKVSTYNLTSSISILCLFVDKYDFFVTSAINLEKWLEVLEVRLEIVIRVLHILVATMTLRLPFVTVSCNKDNKDCLR